MSMKSSGSSIALLSVEQRKAARILDSWQGLIQKHFHENVEAQTVRIFLTLLTKDEPTDLTEINRDIGLSKSALSRNFYTLEKGKGGVGGLDLVTAVTDYNDRRRMVVDLTPKGVEVAKELLDYIPSRLRRNQDASEE